MTTSVLAPGAKNFTRIRFSRAWYQRVSELPDGPFLFL